MVGETANRKRAPFLALLLVMVMILLHTSDCEATSSIMKGNASSPYHARIDEAADYWMFDSEVSRMLAAKNAITPNTLIASKVVVNKCDRGPKYKSCLPNPTGAKQPENCARDRTYNRNC